MKKVINIVFAIFGFYASITNYFGTLIIPILIGIMVHKVLLFVLIAVLILGIDLLRHKQLTKKGMRPQLGMYVKDEQA